MRKYIRSALICLFCLGASGCLESSFELASESRLPNWFGVSKDRDRAEFTLVMEYYNTFSGSETVFKLYDKDHFFYLEKINMKVGDSFVNLKNRSIGPPISYPMYLVVNINGIEEIIEHRKMEPVFYIVDDPVVINEVKKIVKNR